MVRSEAGQDMKQDNDQNDNKPVKLNTGLPVRKKGHRGPNIDLLYGYLRELHRYPLLTPEEEHDLTMKYHETRDPNIAMRLVTANLRLVVKIAFEYSSYTNNILDLIQEGNLGLIQAVQHFDPFRGVRLSHYAQYWIRSYIIYYLLNNHRLVKLGTTQAQRKVFFNLRKEQARLLSMGFKPTTKLLAQGLNVPEQTVTEMIQRMDSPDVSMDTPRSDDNTTTLAGIMPSDTPTPEDAASDNEIMQQFREKMEEFGRQITNERDRFIWENRLTSDDPITLQQIGEKFGVSRERARQIEERLKKNFKSFVEKELGSDFAKAILNN